MPNSTPRVTTIAPGVSFVDALARGLLARSRDPLELSRGTILLPTRRACRALQEAFLRASDDHTLFRLASRHGRSISSPWPFKSLPFRH